MGPWWVWAPALIFGGILALLGFVLNIISFGQCEAGQILMLGLVLVFLGLGIGLATHVVVLAIAEVIALSLVVGGLLVWVSLPYC